MYLHMTLYCCNMLLSISVFYLFLYYTNEEFVSNSCSHFVFFQHNEMLMAHYIYILFLAACFTSTLVCLGNGVRRPVSSHNTLYATCFNKA